LAFKKPNYSAGYREELEMVIVNAIGTTISYNVWSSSTQITSGTLANLQQQEIVLSDSNFKNNDGYVVVSLGSSSGIDPGSIATRVYPNDRDAVIKLSFISPQ
jgi:hypothetical protein